MLRCIANGNKTGFPPNEQEVNYIRQNIIYVSITYSLQSIAKQLKDNEQKNPIPWKAGLYKVHSFLLRHHFFYSMHKSYQGDLSVFERTALSQRRQCHRKGYCWNFCAKDWDRKQWEKLNNCIID